MLSGLITAIRTLTIIPVPGRDTEDLASSLYWFPMVGLLIGGFIYSIAIVDAGWSEGLAVLVVIAEVLLTRGLHLDGLADWADGFWGGRDKESILRIMKDSSIGAFGATALVCAILAQWTCYARLIAAGSQVWIVAACVLSRTMQVVLASTHPYARDTEGTATHFVKNAGLRHMAVAIGASALILAVIGEFNWRWLGPIAAAWFPTRLFGSLCQRRVGGVTGDLLGAASQIVEILVLMLGCFVASQRF